MYSHSRCSAVLDELSVGLASELSYFLDCVRVHGVRGAAHDAIPVSFSADFIFPTAVLSYRVRLCHCADLPLVPFTRGRVDVNRIIEVPNSTKATYDAANSTSTSEKWTRKSCRRTTVGFLAVEREEEERSQAGHQLPHGC